MYLDGTNRKQSKALQNSYETFLVYTKKQNWKIADFSEFLFSRYGQTAWRVSLGVVPEVSCFHPVFVQFCSFISLIYGACGKRKIFPHMTSGYRCRTIGLEINNEILNITIILPQLSIQNASLRMNVSIIHLKHTLKKPNGHQCTLLISYPLLLLLH